MEPIMVVAMIGGLILFLLIAGAPVKPLRFIGQSMIKLMIGALFLFIFNTIGTYFDLHLPINATTVAISGFLGIPGLCSLVLIKQFILI